MIIVSVDGGCKPGLELVASGVIGATAQQYPGKMATLGMQAIKDLADGKPKPAVSPGLDFFNTGVALVTDKPRPTASTRSRWPTARRSAGAPDPPLSKLEGVAAQGDAGRPLHRSRATGSRSV